MSRVTPSGLTVANVRRVFTKKKNIIQRNYYTEKIMHLVTIHFTSTGPDNFCDKLSDQSNPSCLKVLYTLYPLHIEANEQCQADCHI